MEIESRFVGTRERHQMTEYGVCAPGRSCVLLVLVCSVVSVFLSLCRIHCCFVGGKRRPGSEHTAGDLPNWKSDDVRNETTRRSTKKV